MKWKKWSNQVILPETVLTTPNLPRNSILLTSIAPWFKFFAVPHTSSSASILLLYMYLYFVRVLVHLYQWLSKFRPGTSENPWHPFQWGAPWGQKYFHYNTYFFFTLLLWVYSSKIVKRILTKFFIYKRVIFH